MLQLTQRPLTASDADARLFVDREAELSAIERALGLGFNVFLSGPAGSGKTSTLRRVEARLGTRSRFFNAARIDSFDDLIAGLAAAIGAGQQSSEAGRRPGERWAGDALADIRAGALDLEGGASPVVILDGLTDELRHELFGRQRDELWEVPLRWVVTGHGALTPPADAFFETATRLQPLDRRAMHDLLWRRSRTGTPDEQARLEALAETLPSILGPATPRQLLAAARAVMLSDDPEDTLEQLRKQQSAREHVSATAGRVLDALEVLGPTYAGDERLLAEIGTTRSRITQVLRELETAGLVVSTRDGKRKLYGPALQEGQER